ncbi:MAG: PilZ domain-containing protein [Candidatus Methylomirabilales bacterium]
MHRAKEERRRHPRWEVQDQIVGQIPRVPEVSLVNISIGGVLIEHVKIVRPGSFCFLSLLLSGQKVGLKCRVVRSVVHRYELSATGERDLIYRTGLKFLALSETPRRQIEKYIDSLRGERPEATAVRS